MIDIVEQLRIAIAVPICKPAADEIEFLRQQLAASQAREVLLREALEDARTADDLNYCASGAYFTDVIDKALALPQDTTTLEAMIAKAGEVMRERCAGAVFKQAKYFGYNVHAEAVRDAASALPGVTLEDLQK